MTTITFDTLSTARRLREKGFPQEQAEAIADEMRINSSVDISHLATREEVASKTEVASFKSELKNDLKQLDTSLRGEIKELRIATKNDMEILKRDLTMSMGTMITVAVGLIAVLIKFMH